MKGLPARQHAPKRVGAGITRFLTQSDGSAKAQQANEAKPPERKFAVGVLIYGEAVVRGPTALQVCIGKYQCTNPVLCPLQSREPPHENLAGESRC